MQRDRFQKPAHPLNWLAIYQCLKCRSVILAVAHLGEGELFRGLRVVWLFIIDGELRAKWVITIISFSFIILMVLRDVTVEFCLILFRRRIVSHLIFRLYYNY